MLVLAGSRSITEHFFIDPLSGKSYSSDNDHFLGIESVWNNLNYYINMQDCSYGCDVSAHCSHTLLTRSYTKVMNQPLTLSDIVSLISLCLCLQEMLFDLEDLEMWEPVLFGATSKKQLIDTVAKRKAGEEVEETIFKQEVWLSFSFFSFLLDLGSVVTCTVSQVLLTPSLSPLKLLLRKQVLITMLKHWQNNAMERKMFFFCSLFS